MYARLRLGSTVTELNPSNFLQGVKMKKALLALLFLVLGSVGLQAAATNTPTSTFTPTATRTNTPVAGYAEGTGRVVVVPEDFRQADGITAPGVSAVPGGTDIWLAQSSSWTAAVFATGTADARIQVTVPCNYMRGASLWLTALNSSLTNTVTVRADVAKMSLGKLTSTATTIYSGVATNVQTQFTGRLNGARYSRVWVPLSGTVGTYGVVQPGDLLNIFIERTGGSGDLNVFSAEFEYKYNSPGCP